MTKLYYQGHGSCRISSDDGRIIYVDPYAGDGYELPADIILVTHRHMDHDRINLCVQNPGCRIITNKEALAGEKHQCFSINGIEIEAVEAKNLLHCSKKCVGFILSVDGIKIYVAGDTSKTEQMKSFAAKKLDYAMFPCDGIFTMSLEKSAECARLVAAKHNIPIHIKPGALFDSKRAHKWDAPNRLIVEPGEEIDLRNG